MSKGENIEKAISKDIEDLGYEVEYVENVKEGATKILRIVIDKKDTSITTEDCETVSRKVEDVVDKIMPENDSYMLEVSSPGLERELKTDRLYKKYLGENVRIKLFRKLEDKKEINGKLIGVEENYIIVKDNENEIKIEKENIACGNTVYEFEEE